jgi:5-methyltetrahydropteroyltriglutamate--homocysteine methyltransferase
MSPAVTSGNNVMTQRTTPPFRADHVGSLLRTAPLKEARNKRAKGEIDAAALKAVEDREIEKIVRKQEEVGLKLATDGEFRRSWWHFDFYRGLDGVEMYQTSEGIHFAGVDTRAESVRVVGKVSASPIIRTSNTSSSSRRTRRSRRK